MQLTQYAMLRLNPLFVTTYPAGLPLALIRNQPPWARCAGRRPAPTPPVGEGRPEAEGRWRATFVGT